MFETEKSFSKTIFTCYFGGITQAIVNNLAPLLFLTFQHSFGFTLEQITLITTVNFTVQLLTDIISIKLVDFIGYRASGILSHFLAGIGLVGMALLPDYFGFNGLLISVCCYAIGGGLLEVIISPIVEACPTAKKESAMSLLHSFYCWGHAGVVLISTLLFNLLGIVHWRLIVYLWAIIPFFNLINFFRIPLYPIVSEKEKISIKTIIGQKTIWFFLLLMICAGAAEQAMSQWSSVFAESALHMTKTAGDLAGPCSFALLMGTARALYGKYSHLLPIQPAMIGSAALCLLCYLVTAQSNSPIIALIGCALTGFSVGILWPGTFSLAARKLRNGGTAVFAVMAFAGDLGCSIGPSLVGIITDRSGGNFNKGILAAIIFPGLALIILIFQYRRTKRITERRSALPGDMI